MSTSSPNYPDLLGYITGGDRVNVGVVQAAAGLRSPVFPAGNAFEAVVLLQNNSDVNVDVSVGLQLPEQDAARKTERFFIHKDKLNLTLQPAEVGYLMIPMLCLPDTAQGNYHIGVSINASAHGKPRPVRYPSPSTEVNLDYYFFFSEETLYQLGLLRTIAFSTGYRGLIGGMIDMPFQVTPGTGGKFTKLKPRWISLWSLGSHSDARPLLERHRTTFLKDVLPRLNRQTLYTPLFKATQHHLEKAGVPAEAIESHFIVETLLSVIEMAASKSPWLNYPGSEFYYVRQIFERGWSMDGSPVPLPNWCRGLLALLGLNEAITQYPERAIAGPLYSALVRDGIEHGFQVLRPITASVLGEPGEIRLYSDYFIQLLDRRRAGLTFTELYIPLVLAGVVVSRNGISPRQHHHDLLVRMTELNESRWSPDDEDQQLAAEIAGEVLHWSLRQYTHWM
jgi:hypothetical protein